MDVLKVINNLENVRTPDNAAAINEAISTIKSLKVDKKLITEAYEDCADRLRVRTLEYYNLIEDQQEVILNRNSEGYILSEDWNLLVRSCKIIGGAIFDSPHNGMTEDGKDYLPADLVRTPEEIKEALKVVNSFFRA